MFLNKYSKGDGYQDPTIHNDAVLADIANKQDLIDSLDIEVEELINTTSQTPLDD